MSAVRERVLAEVRAALGGGQGDPATIAREAAAITAGPERVQPKFSSVGNVDRFIERATSERVTATVDQVREFAEVPPAVRGYLLRQNVPLEAAMVTAQGLAGLDWGDIAIHHSIEANELVSITLADFGIAETGSLVFHSSPDAPTRFNFLPLHHIAVVEERNILRYMEDYWAWLRATGNPHPRNINFITGTSGTADIEGKNIRGAHGPRFMHIVLIGDYAR
jgi:L-lactate dehydrogenase complex protein LldG